MVGDVDDAVVLLVLLDRSMVLELAGTLLKITASPTRCSLDHQSSELRAPDMTAQLEVVCALDTSMPNHVSHEAQTICDLGPRPQLLVLDFHRRTTLVPVIQQDLLNVLIQDLGLTGRLLPNA